MKPDETEKLLKNALIYGTSHPEAYMTKADELWKKYSGEDDYGTRVMLEGDFLAALKELQSIRSAELPVEPEFFKNFRAEAVIHTAHGNESEVADLVAYIDALKAYALKEKAECQRQTRESFRLARLHEKAESKYAALRGRLMDKVCVDSLAWSTFIDEYDRYSEGDPSVPFSELRNSLVIVIESAVALKEGE